jgi:hypothetical protein
VVCSSNGTLVVGHEFRIVAVDLENKAISTAWLDLLDHYVLDPAAGPALMMQKILQETA